MYFDPLYWLVIGAGMLLSLWAQFRVKSTFSRYSQEITRSGLTGADVARRILEINRIDGVTIEGVQGSLTDHYDPRIRKLRLSEDVYARRSIAAAGVAAHEVGHAIQHAQSYGPLRFRSAWVPVANLGGGVSMFVIIAALGMGGMATALGRTLATVGILMFATTTAFTLITLPVEFDASRRALASLQSGGVIPADEVAGARRVLSAAALTYVAAFVTSLLTLLYWLVRLGLIGGGRRRD
ncbi:zinc metallopeptidase [Candidatus Fermentibacteria bacterium]|nr:zinc metallopeptidase [Candidatus Fermentibacteria bacterium]